MTLLRTDQLTIGYKHHIVQPSLSLSVEEGTLTCMLGTNGCGKSTLLRTLAGLQPALGGRVEINGTDLNALSTHERAKAFSLVLTDPIEMHNTTVFDVIALGRFPHSNWLGSITENDRQHIRQALEQVKLLPKAQWPIVQLSDGERQRVMIARALAQDTPIILLDEPTAHLDLPNRVDTMLLLRQLAHQTGKAVLLSTHELDIALQTADRLWLMSPETGMRCGVPEDLVLNGAFEEVFSSESFVFNPANGNFSVNYTTHKPICVSGDQMRVYWTVRALARMGYCGEEEADIRITASADGWLLNNSIRYKSLERLLDDLPACFSETETK